MEFVDLRWFRDGFAAEFAPATDRRVDLRGNICREDGVM